MGFISLSIVSMQKPQSDQESQEFLLIPQGHFDMEVFMKDMQGLRKSLLIPKTPALNTFDFIKRIQAARALMPKKYIDGFNEYELVELEQMAIAQCKLTWAIVKAYSVKDQLPDDADEVQISDLANAQTKLELIKNFCKKNKLTAGELIK